MKRVSALVTLAVLGAGLGACEQPPGHLPLKAAALGPLPGDHGEQLPATDGAIYRPTPEGNGGLSLVQDHRPYQVGDIITVAITQSAAATKNVSQNIGRSDNLTSTFGDFFGIPLAWGNSKNNGTDPGGSVNKFNPNLQYSSANSLKGSGATAQSDSVVTTVSAMVRRIQPNGDLVLEGENIVQLEGGKEYIRIAGVVRPEDIQGNTVPSTRMADGYIEFSGDGQTYLAPQMGFLQRLFLTVSELWPSF